jgi:hypothetical protein
MYSRNLSALAFAADFLPAAPEFHQRTHRVRLRNLGTTDKKSSHKNKHRKIPRVHCILQVVFFAFYCIVSKRKKPWQELLSTLQKLRRLAGKKQNQTTGVISNIFLV